MTYLDTYVVCLYAGIVPRSGEGIVNRPRPLSSLAVRDYLMRHRQKQVTQRLNEIYRRTNPEDARLTARMKAKFRQAVKERW